MGSVSLEGLQGVVSAGLCHRCGACAGICPRGVVRPGPDGYPSWEGREGGCTDCGLCLRACTGKGFPFPESSRRIFGRATRLSDEHGIAAKAFLGYARDPEVRGRGTSGGVATQIALHMLSKGRARGAFVVVPDTEIRWRPRAVIAREREGVMEGALSKYPACPMLHLFGGEGGKGGPYVLTGLPCHVQGARRLAELSPPVAESLALVVGLICHSCLDHAVLREMIAAYRIDEKEIERVEYRGGKLPGYIRALMKGGGYAYLPYPRFGPDRYRPNAKECLTLFFKLFSPPRCRLCMDATAEFADVSVGDPWVKGWEAEDRFRGGYSFILARSERGLRALEEAQADGALALEPFPLDRVPSSHQPMVRMKRERALYGMERRRRRGLPCPDYGFDRRWTAGERARAAVRASTYFAADRPRLRRAVFRFLLSRPGRIVVGAAFFRRRVLQALFEKAKKQMRGGPAGP